tara:strand:- start:10355 stop:11494 length:1140 start_codon:yes stop_codon:yes gene_type:complete
MNNYNILKERFSITEIHSKILKPETLPKPFYDATMGPFSSYHTSILTLVDNSGYKSEIEYPLSCLEIFKQYFATVLLQSKETLYSDLYSTLFWRIRNEGFRGEAARALGYLDRAFYDIASQRASMPLHHYIGAKRNWAKLYASGGSTGLSDEELVDECLSFKEAGYSIIKIKAGGDFGTHLKEDVIRIGKVRTGLGDDIRLAVDLNQALTVPQTLDFIKEIEDFDIEWLEEPIHSADIMGMEELTSKTSMCISFGESERTFYPFQLMVNAGIGHFQPVGNNMISMIEFDKACKLATKHDLMLSCGSFPNVNAQLIAAQKEDAMCEYLIPYLKPMEKYYIVQPIIKDCKAFLPEINGISIRFDWERITKEKMIEDSVCWK